MTLPGRTHSSTAYRYGFNGKENDDEIMGEGSFQDYGMRMYNPRIGRFFNEDPLTKSFPMLTPYQFASNTPIQSIDLDGLEGYKVVDHIAKTSTIVIDLYYSPKEYREYGDNKQFNNKKFSSREINKIVEGINKEFNKTTFWDSTISDENGSETVYEVKLQINLHPIEKFTDAKNLVSSTMNDPNNSRILLYKRPMIVKTEVLPDGTEIHRKTKGGYLWNFRIS